MYDLFKDKENKIINEIRGEKEGSNRVQSLKSYLGILQFSGTWGVMSRRSSY